MSENLSTQLGAFADFVLNSPKSVADHVLVMRLRTWATDAATIETGLAKMLGLFGDYDYVPSIEACEVTWDTIMVERTQMELRLSEAQQLLEDGGTAADWEGRVAVWLGITAQEEQRE